MLNMSLNSIEASEIFQSFQGEGPSTGRRATFLRTRRCNLSCAWCDTRYTWDKDDAGYSQFEEYTDDTLMDKLRSLPRTPLLVITGGEPLIWAHFFSASLVARLAEVYQRIEIETNGTVKQNTAALFKDPHVFFNVSPKLESSRQEDPKITRIRAETLGDFVKLSAFEGRVNFKFVVNSPADIDEVEHYVSTFAMPREHVYLMLEGVTEESQVGAPLRWLSKQAEKLGVNVTTRLHILAFGDERGT